MDALLSVSTVGSYLLARGLVDAEDTVEARELGGGVSNVVLRVEAPGGVYVVKQSLPKLRVADDWPAKRERALSEAAALEVAERIVPDSVPPVRDVDPEAFVLTIDHAPDGWRSWKEDLLSGRAEPGVAERLGTWLAAWHTGTADDRQVAERFDDAEAFEQLRVDPYYRTVMRRRPDLADAVAPYVEQMVLTHRCLVHGDYSPKNVLVGEDGLWVLDWEVAHLGDPAFDVAFLSNHLMLKAIHRPQDTAGYRECALAFWHAYHSAVPAAVAAKPRYTLGHLGCLMVARVDGKSPAEYLTDPGRAVARGLGTALLSDPPDDPEQAWTLLERVAVR